MAMRMAYTPKAAEGGAAPKAVMEKPEIFGRLKSDVTSGFEKIYERSYY